MATRGRSRSRTVAIATSLPLLALGGCNAPPPAEGPRESLADAAPVLPSASAPARTPGPSPRPEFPSLIAYPDNCPGEGCHYGEWLACDTVPLYDAPNGALRPGQMLLPDQPFEALTGVVVVEQPTVIVVTRPVQQLVARGDTVRFEPGDTVLVLDHSGEGFFHVWHERFVSSVDFFWPIDFGSRPEPYSADVISEGSNSLWVATPMATGDTAWVHATSPEVAPRSYFAPSPICRAR